MKKISFFFLFFQGIIFAQNSVSLDSCVRWAKKNYPLIQQNQEVLNQTSLNQSAISENWYPKINFLAQATYNTEVVAFNFPGMNVSFPHDAYVTSLGFDQLVVDGGLTKLQHQVESINGLIELQKTEIELYKLIERINQLYVNILLGRENVEMLQLYQTDLERRRTNLSAGVQNGLVLSSSLDEIDAEILKTKQTLIESIANLTGLYQTLSFFTDHNISDNTALTQTPLGGIVANTIIQRPELSLFDLQTEMLNARLNAANVFAIPRISVGAAANYGRPGPNFINQQLRFFGSANLTVRWNVSSLYGLNRERKKLAVGKNLLEIQRSVFLFNVNANLTAQNPQLEALSKIIATDDQIISKRHTVTQTAVAQMENGKITVANYLTQLNAELQAKLTKKVHEIKLMNTISSINTTSGAIKF
jgi:outer membrane protein TolC